MLEYKEQLPGNSDRDKREFLADVSAFANTGGGTILYGVAADAGVAREVVGIGVEDVDGVKLRLVNLLHDGVSPSLAQQVVFREVSVPGLPTPVLAVGIPRSLAGPHRVESNGSHRFWRRSDSNKYEPDVPELRRMFVEAQALAVEGEAFRRERLRRLREGEILATLERGAMLLVHVLPLGRLERIIDLRPYQDALTNTAVHTVGGGSPRFNADGFLHTDADGAGEPVKRYAQWFRCGALEACRTDILARVDLSNRPVPLLRVEDLANTLRHAVTRGLAVMSEHLDAAPPVGVSLSLVGVRGSVLAPDFHGGSIGGPLDRDEMAFPMIVIEESGADVRETLRPLVDMVWQAYGYQGAPSDRW